MARQTSEEQQGHARRAVGNSDCSAATHPCLATPRAHMDTERRSKGEGALLLTLLVLLLVLVAVAVAMEVVVRVLWRGIRRRA